MESKKRNSNEAHIVRLDSLNYDLSIRESTSPKLSPDVTIRDEEHKVDPAEVAAFLALIKRKKI